LVVTTDFSPDRLPVWRARLESTHDGFICAVLEPEGPGVSFPRLHHFVDQAVDPLPPSLFLHLLRLNLESLERVIDFCSQTGPMYGTTWSEFIPVEWVEPHYTGARLPTRVLEREIERRFPDLAALRERVEERAEGEDEPFFHPEEFRIRARALRDMTRVHLVVSGVRTWAWATEGWESGALFPCPQAPEEAMQEFVLPLLNVGLAELHPGIEMAEGADRRDYSLYSVLCLQLARAIAAGQDYADCPQCGKPFSKEARAYEDYVERVNAVPDLFVSSDLRQRSADVLYCSRRCANAASSKMYRERGKAARAEAGNPVTPSPSPE
jgi:hypothetical protein